MFGRFDERRKAEGLSLQTQSYTGGAEIAGHVTNTLLQCLHKHTHTRIHMDTHPLALRLSHLFCLLPFSDILNLSLYKTPLTPPASHIPHLRPSLWQPRLLYPFFICQPWFCSCSSSYFHPSVPEKRPQSCCLWWAHTLFEIWWYWNVVDGVPSVPLGK